MDTTRCLKRLKKFKTKKNITLNFYEGYSLIHIDVKENEIPVAWLTIDNNYNMKICKTKECFGENHTDEHIIRTIVKLAKFLKLNEVYGRIYIENDNCTNLFKTFNFKISEQFDKKEKTIKVKLKTSN